MAYPARQSAGDAATSAATPADAGVAHHLPAASPIACFATSHYYYLLYKLFLKNLYNYIYSTVARASLKLIRLGVHISCHYLLYINIVISVHCTLDFGPPNLLYNIV